MKKMVASVAIMSALIISSIGAAKAAGWMEAYRPYPAVIGALGVEAGETIGVVNNLPQAVNRMPSDRIASEAPFNIAGPDDLKKMVQLGMAREEVQKRLGPAYAEFSNNLDGTPVSRYDLVHGALLSPDGSTINGDEVDIEGLKKGALQAQLYINWNAEGTRVSRFTVFYSDNDREVVEYRVFSDGQIREMKISG